MRLGDILELNGVLPRLAGGALTTEFLEEREVNAEFGEIFWEGHHQADLIAFSGTVDIEKRELPVAGADNIVYRRGRVRAPGTMSIAKCDSRFEELMIKIAGTNVNERRELRNKGIDPQYKTYITIKLDDPDAWGAEEMGVYGLRLWNLPIGFSGQSIIQRDLSISWQSEKLLRAIPRPGEDPIFNEFAGTRSPEGQTFPAYTPGGVILP